MRKDAFALVWVQIDAPRQRSRLLANRGSATRSDVVDGVIPGQIEHFDEPVDEEPIINDADDTASSNRVQEVVDAIRCRRSH
ncbi:hypothetical protein [uncultured Arthrobacter sp.]|uniref:hypothetical protein n=1 Tax=uncultured Arthrobacter sp. TaxID=114050 RepID=UPI0026109C7B|nr:hypothetical protein [uncultured Arthrobacter sp.]